MKDMNWFKSMIEPTLQSYQKEYNTFENGDFGKLDQVRFESVKYGGNIDFWEQGWIGIFVWDYEAEIEIMNTLLEPHEINKINDAFEKLKKVI